MAINDIISPKMLKSPAIGSVATDSSTYFAVSAPMASTGELLSIYFQNSTTNAVASGTTSGSAVTLNVYKNASSAGSTVGSFNGSGTTIATLATQNLPFSGTTNFKFNAGDLFIAEVVGGAANNQSNAGAYFVLNFMYARSTGTVPAAGTGPA